MKRLILIDGNSLLFRAYFAMRPMVTSKGMHTQGVFAFVNMLNKIIADYSPTHIAVAFDMKGGTFRHDVYAEYKAGRLKTPPELLSQIPMMHEVLDAMNIAVFEKPQYEADDIIGTISSRAEQDGIDTLVISGDKDELQLVGEHVNVLINRRGMSEFDLYDLDAMKERYGLTPEQFIDLKGLMGDSSDNIPGVPGIGEKKGIALLEEYGTLENVLEHADEIKGRMGENIRENKETARMSKWLATINREAPVDFTWEDLEYTGPDMKKLVEVYTGLEFNSFLRKLQTGTQDEIASPAASRDLRAALDEIRRVSLEKFMSAVSAGSEVFMEASTDACHLKEPEIKSIALYSDEKGVACVRELTPMDEAIVISGIADMQYRLCGCGLKRIVYSLLSKHEAEYFPCYDAAIAEYLLDANRQKYPLDKLLLRYNGYVAPEEESAALSDAASEDSLALADEDLLKRSFYAACVRQEQSRALDEAGCRELFDSCEMPLVLTLALMEREGIRCDRDILRGIGEELTSGINELEAGIYEEAGTEFNINSPKQLGSVLFEKLQIPYPKQGKNKSGSYSTAADVLEKLRGEYRIVEDVLSYRKLSKLNSTYVEGLLPLIGEGERVRPHFMQMVAATGRLSCIEPNLQNIPIRDEYGRLIRKAFTVSSEDFSFTGSDYSQIELRILAALSGDESLIADFREGKDIHRATASRVFDIPEDEVTPLDRTRAKAVNFGVVYGMSGFGLGESLNISRTEGQKYINEYFSKHMAVKEYLDRQIESGEEDREVRTYFGRIRKIPEFASRKFMERELAKRLAMNTPIQGTAADIIKIAMNSVSEELRKRGLRSKLILQIHDELIVEGPDSETDQVREILDTCMRGAADLAVDLVCDIHTGKTWYELK